MCCIRLTCLSALLALAACGGGGGGGSTAATSTPAASPGAVTPTATGALADAEALEPFVTAADVPDDGRVVVDFQLTDQDGVAITDLAPADLRLTVAKLTASPVGNLRGDWQSYINRIEMPSVGPGTEPALQATQENATSGTLTNNGDGTYVYRFAASITDITDQAVLNQAAVEGLNLGYEPDRTHRVALEFRNAAEPANTSFDWIPATGVSQLDGIYHYDVAATANCNDCHLKLEAHGGSRIEVRYCVTCHNPGTTDANSGNSVSFREMVHKIHMGANLPSVQAGTPYVIYGFQNAPHDYSDVRYPGELRNCTQCHGGNASGADTTQITDAGDNWYQFATQEACGACHDDLDFSAHWGAQPDDENCMSCHQTSGIAGSIRDRHAMTVLEAARAFEAQILDITGGAPGQPVQVRFSIVDPTNSDAAYDILSDPAWTQPGGASRLAVDVAWSTSDYTNTGNGAEDASAVSIDALATAQAVGDGSFVVTSPVAVPDGTLPPGIPATGSGAVAIEGHPAVDVGSAGAPDVQRIPMTNVIAYFSIDESDGQAVPRRTVVALDSCLSCHDTLSLHGNNRTDNVQVCAVCHNPRNTDRETRAIARVPPTDGKDEESIDLKTMVHGIHASAMRENPLQLVGFGGFTTYVYDEEEVQYPGVLSNCVGCHAGDSYAVPLPATVLGTTFDTGSDYESRTDDRVITPTSATCSACHDSDAAKSHMISNGGSFDTTQAAIDSGAVLEQCEICHGSGRVADVRVVHDLR